MKKLVIAATAVCAAAYGFVCMCGVATRPTRPMYPTPKEKK